MWKRDVGKTTQPNQACVSPKLFGMLDRRRQNLTDYISINSTEKHPMETRKSAGKFIFRIDVWK